MKGQIIIIKLRKNDASQLGYLNAVSVGYKPSPLTIID